MMTFHLRLKRTTKPKDTRIKFDLEKLKDPSVLETFQAMIGGKFAPLTIVNNGNAGIDSMITIFITTVTETTNEILGKHRQKNKQTDKQTNKPGTLQTILICATKGEN